MEDRVKSLTVSFCGTSPFATLPTDLIDREWLYARENMKGGLWTVYKVKATGPGSPLEKEIRLKITKKDIDFMAMLKVMGSYESGNVLLGLAKLPPDERRYPPDIGHFEREAAREAIAFNEYGEPLQRFADLMAKTRDIEWVSLNMIPEAFDLKAYFRAALGQGHDPKADDFDSVLATHEKRATRGPDTSTP